MADNGFNITLLSPEELGQELGANAGVVLLMSYFNRGAQPASSRGCHHQNLFCVGWEIKITHLSTVCATIIEDSLSYGNKTHGH